MPKEKKLTKKELRRDPIREFLLESVDWSKKNKEKVIWGIAIFLVAVVAAGFFYGTKNRSSSQNRLKLLSALAAYSQNDTTQFVTILQNLINVSGGSIEGKRALYYLAQYKLERGDIDAAETYTRKYLKSKLGDPILDAGAYALLGSIAIERGNPEESVRYYLEAKKTTPYESFKIFYSYKAARAYVEANQYEKALEILKELTKDYPDNSLVQGIVKNEIPLLEGELKGQNSIYSKEDLKGS